MHRSYLLSLDFKVTSLTEWAAQLKINPLYALLSGFEFGDTPGVGTFYDFLNRIWNSNEDNLNPHVHPVKTSVIKPSAKGAKAKPVEKVSVEQLLAELEGDSSSASGLPYASLFDLYNHEFLQKSVSQKLINPDSLALAGDGTPVVTSARERKHRVCDCASKCSNDCCCDRYFSQPDCDIGWDSSRSCIIYQTGKCIIHFHISGIRYNITFLKIKTYLIGSCQCKKRFCMIWIICKPPDFSLIYGIHFLFHLYDWHHANLGKL